MSPCVSECAGVCVCVCACVGWLSRVLLPTCPPRWDITIPAMVLVRLDPDRINALHAVSCGGDLSQGSMLLVSPDIFDVFRGGSTA